MEQKQQLPNATAVLVLGICSIVFSCMGVGLVLGIIGLVLSAKPRKMYRENPSLYEGYGTLTGGFVTSIIGTCFSAIVAFIYIIECIIAGAILSGAAFSSSHFGN